MGRLTTEDLGERTRAVLRMTQKNMSVQEIADQLGISPRSVCRHRKRAGIHDTRMTRRFTEEELELATSLLEDGAPYAEVARTIKCNPSSLRKRLPGYGWEPGWQMVNDYRGVMGWVAS